MRITRTAIQLGVLAATIIIQAGCTVFQPKPADSSPDTDNQAMAMPEILGGPPERDDTHTPLEWVKSKKYEATGPVSVDLKEIKANVYDPKNKLARGWGQEGKPKRITKRISPEEAQRLRDEAMKLPPSQKLRAAQTTAMASQAPTAGIGFESLDLTDCCGGGANTPPDPELAVGPDHLIAVVNASFEVYDKSGSVLAGPITFSSFMSDACSGSFFDPNVLYDEQADRFILGIDVSGTHYCVAVSQGSNPIGSWWIYKFQTDFADAFFDFPHAGVGVDAIFMGSNQFGGTLPDGFEGRVFAMDKNAMYNGQPAAIVSKSTGLDGTPQPMNLHGFKAGTWPS